MSNGSETPNSRPVTVTTPRLLGGDGGMLASLLPTCTDRRSEATAGVGRMLGGWGWLW